MPFVAIPIEKTIMQKLTPGSLLIRTVLMALLLASLVIWSQAKADDTITTPVTRLGVPQQYSDSQVWPVWCEADNRCTQNGEPISLNQLIRSMPVASWGWCRGNFCYGDERLSDVIGLNPKLFIYPRDK